MSHPTVPGVIQSKLRWTVGSQPNVYSHIYWSYSGGAPSNADITAMATDINAKWVTNMIPLTASGLTQTLVQCIDLSSVSSPIGQWVGSSNGSRLGGVLPAETALLINAHIARRYRGGKPRLYLPLGCQTDVLNPQSWSSSFLTAVATGFTNFFNAISGHTYGSLVITNAVNVSYYSAHTARPTPLVDPWTGFTINAMPASQRRRMNR